MHRVFHIRVEYRYFCCSSDDLDFRSLDTAPLFSTKR